MERLYKVAKRSRKSDPEFNVADFLRPTDTDLRSALTSLLHGNAQGTIPEPPSSTEPAPDIIPGPEFNQAILGPDIKLISEQLLTGGPSLGPPPALLPGSYSLPAPMQIAASISTLPLNLGAGVIKEPVVNQSPGLSLVPPINVSTPTALQRKKVPAIRRAESVADGHTRAEQQIYEALWSWAKPLDDVSRTITMGFAAMARLVRLSESNTRINVRTLIQKLAIEEHSSYDCAQSLGRTYRLFNYMEILQRRRAAGLEWYIRKTQAVIFVDPVTQQPLTMRRPATTTTPASNKQPGTNKTPGLNLIREHLSQYGPADESTVIRLVESCAGTSVEELAHLIHKTAVQGLNAGYSDLISFIVEEAPKRAAKP